MTANIQSAGNDIDTLFATFVSTSPVNNTGYQVSATDIRTRFDPIATAAQINLGARIPAINITTSATGYAANTDLASIFAGNPGQYSLTTPANGTRTANGWTTPNTWTHTITVTFTSAAALTNYFFFGGRIQLSPSKTTGNAADNTMNAMFVAMGTLVIYDLGHYRTGAGGTITNAGTGGSNIGTGSTAFYNTTDGTPYTNNTYVVNMVANAASGSATVLTITTVLTTPTTGTVADTYTGTPAYTSSIQQRNHPTQPVPTFGGSLV